MEGEISLEDTRNLLASAFGGEKNIKELKGHPQKMLVFAKTLLSLAQVHTVKKTGKRAFWLPSSADEPDPKHMRYYGKWLDEIPNGELPGERYGCKCGIGYK